MTATGHTPGVLPDATVTLRARLLDLLRTAPGPLTTDEIRQQLDLPSDTHTTHRLYHELNRLYAMRRVEVERRSGAARRQNMWRAAETAGGAR